MADYDSDMWAVFDEGLRIADEMRALQRLVILYLRMITYFIRIDGDVRDIRSLNNRLVVAQTQLEELREEFLEHVRALRVYEHIL